MPRHPTLGVRLHSATVISDANTTALSPRYHRASSAALDLGCGPGLLSQRLTARADETLGLDVADAAIKLARAHAKGVSGLTFAQADLMDLPRELNRRFDLVVIADTL